MSEERQKQPQEPIILDMLLYIRIDDVIYTQEWLKNWYKKKEDEN